MRKRDVVLQEEDGERRPRRVPGAWSCSRRAADDLSECYGRDGEPPGDEQGCKRERKLERETDEERRLERRDRRSAEEALEVLLEREPEKRDEGEGPRGQRRRAADERARRVGEDPGQHERPACPEQERGGGEIPVTGGLEQTAPLRRAGLDEHVGE